MSPRLHQRLLNEAALHGTEEVLRRMPVEHSPELEQAIRQGVRQAVLYYAEGLDSLERQLHPLQRGKAPRMSWTHRVRNPGAPPLRDVQAAARNLADQAGIAPGKVRVVFQTVADVALLGTVLVSGALAAVHLYKSLFPKHKEDQHSPQPAAGDGSPPRRRGPRVTAAADAGGGYEDARHRSR